MNPPPNRPRPSRRTAMATALAAWLAPTFAWGQDPEAEADLVREKAKKVGLGPLRESRNDEYLAVGDAPEAFLGAALNFCTEFARDYLKHFADKGFPVAKPAKRMTLVVLSGREAFAAYVGGDPSRAVGGIYDLETNRLILFDNRGGGNVGAERDNTLVLFHEATHQLTFNTGLLDPRGDVPLAIAEGLGMYGESRPLAGRNKFGALNERRLQVLVPPRAGRRFQPEITPVADLIAGDDRLLDPKTEQHAYSEAWLLVYYLMKNPERLPQFRDYLKAIAPRRDPSRRLEDWEAAFGDPAKLDRELARYAVRVHS